MGSERSFLFSGQA